MHLLTKQKLKTQHQSAGNAIANSDNESLKRDYLPLMGSGEILVGVGFSHLRRHGEPIMKQPCLTPSPRRRVPQTPHTFPLLLSSSQLSTDTQN